MSDASGNLTEGPYTYDPYGNGAPTAGVPYKYTCRRLDPETGLYYYRARYYSPALGRFLQTDPVGYEDDLDLYDYVGGDPLDKVDPSGEAAATAYWSSGITVGVGFVYKSGRYSIYPKNPQYFRGVPVPSQIGTWHSWGLNFGLGVNLYSRGFGYCGQCQSVSDIAGRSQSVSAGAGVNLSAGSTGPRNMEPVVGIGLVDHGGAHNTYATSIGIDAGIIPYEDDNTTIESSINQGAWVKGATQVNKPSATSPSRSATKTPGPQPNSGDKKPTTKTCTGSHISQDSSSPCSAF